MKYNYFYYDIHFEFSSYTRYNIMYLPILVGILSKVIYAKKVIQYWNTKKAFRNIYRKKSYQYIGV